MFSARLENKVEVLAQNTDELLAGLRSWGLAVEAKAHLLVPLQTLEKFRFIDKSFRKKQLRWMTKTLYEQTRFNLFVESPRGFAELIAESLLWWRDGDAPNASVLTSRLESIIGRFDLDPLRVCDVLLDVFIANPPKKGRADADRLAVLRLFSRTNLLTLVEYRLHHLAGLRMEERAPVLKRLLGFCLGLFRLELASIEDVWSLLTPVDENEIFSGFLRKEQLAFEYFESNFVVMIKHDERKKQQNLERKQLLEDYFAHDRATPQTRDWGKLTLAALFLKEDFRPGVDWLVARWAGGHKVDWTVSRPLLDAMLGFLRRELARVTEEYATSKL